MPIKIPSGLPARDILDSERIFALEKPEAGAPACASAQAGDPEPHAEEDRDRNAAAASDLQEPAAGRGRLHEDLQPTRPRT